MRRWLRNLFDPDALVRCVNCRRLVPRGSLTLRGCCGEVCANDWEDRWNW